MSHPTPPPPVPRLDAPALVRELNVATGAGLVLTGRPAAGEVGAAFVRWPDGHEGVLTRGPGDVTGLERTAEVLKQARARGVPCPRYELIQRLPGGTAVVQERMPGSPPSRIDDGLIHAMIAITDRFGGILADRPGVPVLDLYLDRSGPGYCLHESLERHDARTRRLLGKIREVGRGSVAMVRGDDLVHLDFHPWNVLVDEAGDISGIIDWDVAARGDRAFCLVTLAFDLAQGARFSSRYESRSATAMRRVLDRLDAMNEDLIRAYWAHMSLRLVDWSIRHHTSEVVDHYLDFASTRLGQA